jgi:hypothetical protein
VAKCERCPSRDQGWYAQPWAARGSRESERRRGRRRRETIMIRRREKGDVRRELKMNALDSSRRTGTRFGGPMHRRPARERRRSRRRDHLTALTNRHSSALASVDSLFPCRSPQRRTPCLPLLLPHCKKVPTRNVVFRTNEPATAAGSKRVGPFSWASQLLLYAHILIPLSVFGDAVRCPFTFLSSSCRTFTPATLQVMALLRAQSAHIVCRPAASASSRNLPRYALSLS